jgi:S1-C subfamily serine protease
MKMSGWKKTLLAAVALLVTAPIAAQETGASPEARAAGEAARAAEESARTYRARAPENNGRTETIEVQMREAEERLAEAAARVAELSTSRLPQFVQRMQRSMHPVMGITIGGDDAGGPVEGVVISGVTPGSAASEAGLRSGDIITAINGESFNADDPGQANQKLLDFMTAVEEGDTLDVEYLRNGQTASVEVKPRAMPDHAFAFRSPDFRGFAVPGVPAAPAAPDARFFNFYAGSGSWGDMELVSLTEDLGRYFGTKDGLLIVRAPVDENLKLRDGDVIQRIDGREPKSVSHAMRILGSYQGGETLEIEIMRDKKRQTLEVEMPDNRQSEVREFGFRVPAAAAEPAEP